MTNPVIQVLIRARDEASRVVKVVADALGALKDKAAQLPAAISGALGAVGGISAAGAIKAAGDLEQALARVQAKGDETYANTRRLREELARIAAQYGTTSAEAAQGLEVLAAAGLGATDALRALPSVLALARNESIGFEQAAGLITDGAAVLGLSFAEAARLADVFTRGANLSTTSAAELGTALKYAGAQGKAAGLDLEQVTALLDALAQSGLRGEQAGTALRNIFTALADPASKAREELAKLGDSSGDLAQAIETLAQAGPPGEQAILAFGAEAGPALRALLASGVKGIADYEQQLRGAAGAADEAARKLSDNLPSAFRRLVASVTEAAERLGEPLLGPLKAEIDSLAQRIRAAADDGTLAAFGERIRTAFTGAQQWVRAFVADLDFGTALTRLQQFTEQAGIYLNGFGIAARTVAGGVSLAFNALLTGASLLGAGVAKVASVVVDGLAGIERAASRVGLGSEERARELEIKAEGLRGVYAALADEAASSAGRVTAAWNDMSAAATASAGQQAAAQQQVQRAQQAAAAAITLTADELDAYTRAIEANAAATAAAAAANQQAEFERQQAANASAQAVFALRQEAERLAQAGDFAGAAAKWRAFAAAIQSAGKSGGDAEKAITAAFSKLKLTPQAALDALAKQSRVAFETIRDSGTAAAEDVRRAFLAYAKDQLAAVAEGTAAQQAEIRALLESQAAVLGLRDAYLELAGVRNGDTEGRRRNAEATKDATEQQENANAAQREGASATQGMAQALATARAELYGLSQAAGIAYDKLTATQTGEMWPALVAEQIRGAEAAAAGGAEQFRYLAEQAREAARAAEYFGRARAGFALDAFADQAILLERVKERFYETAAAVAETQQRLEDATKAGIVGLQDVATAASLARSATGLLDAQQLDGLNGAIESARQKLAQFKDEAAGTLAALRDELDQLNGDEVAIENRRAAARQLELRRQLDAARAAGDAEAIRALTEAGRLAEQIHARKLAQIREQAEAERTRAAQSTARTTATAAASTAAAPAAATAVRTLPVRTVRLEIPGVGTLEATEASANRVLDQLGRARSTSV